MKETLQDIFQLISKVQNGESSIKGSFKKKIIFWHKSIFLTKITIF